MNAKDTVKAVPLVAAIAAAAPGLLIVGGISVAAYFGLKWLLSDDKDKKPGIPSAPVPPERPAFRPVISANIPERILAIPANSARNLPVPPIPARIPVPNPPMPSASVSPPVPPRPVPVPPPSVVSASIPAPKIPVPSPSSAVPASVPAMKPVPEIPVPPPKKFIAREDLAKIFTGGRKLTRKSAVAALKALGFGKTAAYQALEINGRFAPWLEFASGGIITWKD